MRAAGAMDWTREHGQWSGEDLRESRQMSPFSPKSRTPSTTVRETFWRRRLILRVRRFGTGTAGGNDIREELTTRGWLGATDSDLTPFNVGPSRAWMKVFSPEHRRSIVDKKSVP